MMMFLMGPKNFCLKKNFTCFNVLVIKIFVSFYFNYAQHGLCNMHIYGMNFFPCCLQFISFFKPSFLFCDWQYFSDSGKLFISKAKTVDINAVPEV